MIEIALIVSVLLNLFLLWYARNTLINLLYLSENLGSLYDLVNAFTNHLKVVYELERFYGDPTLTELLEHSKALRQELETYEEVFLLTESPAEEEEVEPDDKEET